MILIPLVSSNFFLFVYISFFSFHVQSFPFTLFDFSSLHLSFPTFSVSPPPISFLFLSLLFPSLVSHPVPCFHFLTFSFFILTTFLVDNFPVTYRSHFLLLTFPKFPSYPLHYLLLRPCPFPTVPPIHSLFLSLPATALLPLHHNACAARRVTWLVYHKTMIRNSVTGTYHNLTEFSWKLL